MSACDAHVAPDFATRGNLPHSDKNDVFETISRVAIKSSVPLCERCANYDREHAAEIEAVFKASGIKAPESIWCKASDRPEDMRWDRCELFEAMR